ncbi:hypothetical protein ACWEQL_06960 [Kitasatospora sp. NPDC004240]
MTAEPTERIARIRHELAALGLTQPQYWMLRYLSPDDLGADAPGRTVDELATVLGEFLLPGDNLPADADALLARQLVTRDRDGRLRPTADGQAAHARVKTHLPAIRARLGE